MFERFTESSRRVVRFSHDEAVMAMHNYVGTEHLLLGLLREEDGRAAAVLAGFGLTAERARAEVLRIVGPGQEAVAADRQVPFTPRLVGVLREAERLAGLSVETEDLLLALALEPEGVAARILVAFGIPVTGIQSELADTRWPMGATPPDSSPVHSEVELGWRARSIALAALGAAVLSRSAFDVRNGARTPLEMQLLVYLALLPGGTVAGDPDADIAFLSGSLACDDDDLDDAARSLVEQGLVAFPLGQEGGRVAITGSGVAEVEAWLPRISSLFTGWPATISSVDDAVG
jgi:hypothetical protein